MMDHAFHHVDGRSGFVFSGGRWNPGSQCFRGFLLIVIRQNIFPPPVDPGIVDRLDALTFAAFVMPPR